MKHRVFAIGLKLTPMLTLMLSLVLPVPAQAQGVWRCGADGRTYSDSPCPGGRVLEVGPARSAADAAAAREDMQRQLAWAQASRAERERTEMRLLAASAKPANLGPVPKKASVKRLQGVKVRGEPPRKLAKQPQKRPASEAAGTWQATVPASRQTKG